MDSYDQGTDPAVFNRGAESTLRDEASGRFLPGTRPGPGRPRKGEALTDRLRYYAEHFTVKQLRAIRIADLTPKDALAVRQLLDSLKTSGSQALRARAYTYNRLDGLPRQTVDVNHDAQERTEELFDALADWVAGGANDPDALAADADDAGAG